MQHDLVIKGGTLATASETFSADIGIRDGKIATLGHDLNGDDVIDATDKLVLPGGIEAHCHIACCIGGCVCITCGRRQIGV